jgi:hypothetical protein
MTKLKPYILFEFYGKGQKLQLNYFLEDSVRSISVKEHKIIQILLGIINANGSFKVRINKIDIT